MFFENFEKRIEAMFTGLKEDLLASLHEKDTRIAELKGTVDALQIKVSKLENQIDEADNYEHRDAIILNGPAVPEVSTHENTTSLAQDLIKK